MPDHPLVLGVRVNGSPGVLNMRRCLTALCFRICLEDVTLQELGFYTRYCVKGCFIVIPVDNLVLRLCFDKLELRNCNLEEQYQSK